jgi:hypothetical protein
VSAVAPLPASPRPLPSQAVDIEPDFRPYTATDDGARLVLRREPTASALLLRGSLYMLLVVDLALFVLIPAAAWSRTGSDWASIVTSGVSLALLLPLNYLVLVLVLWGFRLDGVWRLECAPGELAVFTRGVLGTRHTHVRGVVALEARSTRVATEDRDVRWLRLYARSDGDRTALGLLALPPEPDAARDAAADAAAARIAARLKVPLERYSEAGERLF